MTIYGGIVWSKRLVLQSYHGSSNWPRKYLYRNQNARIGFGVLIELEYRID